MTSLPESVEDAFETYGQPGQGQLFLTCEHASNRVPAPIRTTERDRAWLASHWGFDIGARNVTREIIRQTGSFGVFARYSRLVCDANRAPEHRDLMRRDVEGTVISFNRDISDAERQRRIVTLHDPYHHAIDRYLGQRLKDSESEVVLVSVHSFTPVWNNRVRPMDVGVLFEPYEAVAQRLRVELDKEGFDTALNRPYSGREGLIYAAARHGHNHGLVFLELEINQSLCCTPAKAKRVAGRIAAALTRLKVRQIKR